MVNKASLTVFVNWSILSVWCSAEIAKLWGMIECNTFFLSFPDVHVEGLFRIPGNSSRQSRLKDLLSMGRTVDLESSEFTPHDAACVLKTFLSELPEPLLTDKHYEAHIQAAGTDIVVCSFLAYFVYPKVNLFSDDSHSHSSYMSLWPSADILYLGPV